MQEKGPEGVLGRLPPWIFGLRFRGVWLVLLALIPAIALSVYSSVEERAQESRTTQDQQLQLARLVAAHHESLLSDSERLLAPLSVLFALVKGDVESARGDVCDSLLVDLLDANADYRNIVVAAPNGNPVCTARTPEASNYGSLAFFQQALNGAHFTIGAPQSDTQTTERWLDFGLPVKRKDGEIVGVVVASLDLASLDRVAMELGLPADTTVLVSDRNGIILSRSPDVLGLAGTQAEGAAFDSSSATLTGKGSRKSLQGEASLFAFSTLIAPNGQAVARVEVSLPESVAYAAANSDLKRNLTLLFVTGVVSLLLAWWLSGRFLLRPTRQLMQVARRIADGDLTVRVGPGYEKSELGALSKTFDEMAGQLQERTEQTVNVNRALDKRVKERTSELERVNGQLQATIQELEHAVLEGGRLERSLEQRTVALEIANKELESFAYSVSHDLRAPLRAIDGFSQTLMRDYEDKLDERGRDRLTRVRTAAQRLGGLIDDLLALSRTSRAEMKAQRLDLGRIAGPIARDLKESDPKRDVEFLIAEDMYTTADAGLMRSLLQNLMSNAWKFTSKHPHALIEVGQIQVDGETVFFVRDDGAGFDMRFVGKLFGPFQRLHSEGEFPGYGIGLATTQRIVRRHGGRIWAESDVEKGATFFFTLNVPESRPLLEEAAAA